MAVTHRPNATEKKHWWLSNRKVVYKYIKDARNLIATREQSKIASAVCLLEAALSLSPRLEPALELKARSLVFLRRFKDVANMLQDYIPSLKMGNEDPASGSLSSDLSRERVKLLPSSSSSSLSESMMGHDPTFKCFSISDLKKKVMAGLSKNVEKEGHWRYVILGQACCHLGLMEDAMVLLQTGKRLASAAFRRESVCWSEDSFDSANLSISSDIITTSNTPSSPPRTALTESENINRLLCHIKLLIRRKTAALAALDAGLYPEAIRHFTKIVDSRRGAPQGFLAECCMHRAIAYKSQSRIAESIADCNRTLALDTTCIQALETRASLLETIRCIPESLHDLEHLKLLYNSILRDRKLPGPAWKRQNLSYREIPGKLCVLTTKIQQLKQKVASGETGNVDYYMLIGVRRGCSKSELERAHLLLSLRHKPDKANSFMERCEFADERDVESIKERAKMSALLLYRLLQKGYSSVKTTIVDEEAADKERQKAAAALQAAQTALEVQQKHEAQESKKKSESMQSLQKSSDKEISDCIKLSSYDTNSTSSSSGAPNQNVFPGTFCRDLAVVTNMLSQSGFERPLAVKYEALSC